MENPWKLIIPIKGTSQEERKSPTNSLKKRNPDPSETRQGILQNLVNRSTKHQERGGGGKIP